VDERIPSNQLIYVVKRVKRRDLLDFISDEVITSIKNSIKYENYVITNVPRKRNRVMKYGLDHSEEIAKCISRKLGIGYVKLLKSKSKKAQKKTHGEERLKNAKFDYVRKPDDVEGKRVILVDDIVTTGASMGASAMLIRALGAKEVVGASLAIAFRDVYRPFEETMY
jgi:ComF family protein